jgi:hypothetical protein
MGASIHGAQMQLKIDGNVIEIRGKEPNGLDEKVAKFIKVLDKIDYVIISGYIAILFGRSRSTEDIDLLVLFRGKEEFFDFYERLHKEGYYLINAMYREDAYALLMENVPIRAAANGEIMPNFEMKLPTKEIDKISMQNKRIVRFGEYELNTSSLELQIAYKLFLGSEKDYLDATHLYDVYGEYLDKDTFDSFIKMLNINNDTLKKVLDIDKP